MIRSRSSRSTSTGMPRMRLAMCSWGGATLTMRSKYGLGRMCGKTSIFIFLRTEASRPPARDRDPIPRAPSEDGAGGGEGFARDLRGRAGPRLGIGRLVARVAGVAAGGDAREELA